eukprot:6172809-Pleurochrysis_carterae.AAC.2
MPSMLIRYEQVKASAQWQCATKPARVFHRTYGPYVLFVDVKFDIQWRLSMLNLKDSVHLTSIIKASRKHCHAVHCARRATAQPQIRTGARIRLSDMLMVVGGLKSHLFSTTLLSHTII